MKFFDWCNSDVSSSLRDPHVKSIIRWSCKGIYDKLMDNSYVDYFYQWDIQWLVELRMLEEEDAIDLIYNTAWSKLSPIRAIDDDSPDYDIEDYQEWKRISVDEFDDPYRIEHYVYMHRCYIIALVIYYLVSTMYPNKKFLICDTNEHAFVIEEGVEDVIYDIFWWYLELGLPDKPWKTYDNIMKYAHDRLIIDDYSTTEDEFSIIRLNVLHNSFLDSRVISSPPLQN
jgi:hypothetical protein